ncbi:MAG: C39 family peptidase, partial [Caldilineaceae bacterium]|nr:C39 family peptidase [Caldilineaceae bacterium]
MSDAMRRALPQVLIELPLVRQATGDTCGVAALQSVLHYFGQSIRQDVLAEALGADPEHGTNYKRMAAFAQANGITCKPHEGLSPARLRAMLAAGTPVMIALQAWGEPGIDYA